MCVWLRSHSLRSLSLRSHSLRSNSLRSNSLRSNSLRFAHSRFASPTLASLTLASLIIASLTLASRTLASRTLASLRKLLGLLFTAAQNDPCRCDDAVGVGDMPVHSALPLYSALTLCLGARGLKQKYSGRLEEELEEECPPPGGMLLFIGLWVIHRLQWSVRDEGRREAQKL